MLDVRRMRLLRELAYRGTIAAVAQALSYTPSAVSQQLAVLEREAGVPLLTRTGRNVILTPAGQMLVGHAEVVLERLEQAAAELATASAGLTGTLRIGVFPSAARQLLPHTLATLAQEHPGLEPMIDEIDPADVAELVRTGDLDAALVHEYDLVPTGPDLALATEPLLDEPMYLATPNPPAGGADPVQDSAQQPWIMGRPGTLCHDMAVRACQSAGFSPRIRHRIDDFTAVLALVAAGQGVALVPHLATVDVPATVVLAPLPMRRRTHVVFRRGAGRSPAVLALTAALRAAVEHVDPAALPVAGPVVGSMTTRGRMDPMQLHPNVQAVQDALDAAGAGDAAGNPSRVRMLPDAVHTAIAAAAALGVEVGQIANSLVFDADGLPLLALTSGAHRADTAKLAAAVGATRVRRATADFVREHTGQPIGGVAPLGHPKPIPTIVDPALSAYGEIWAAGGVPRAVFPTTYVELTRITAATPVEIA
jgi:DNA-binding transcriptional LysR family regulator/prolyl-tRNA editing enzyme YbaK/EbsC (Cys-tRNA(Pro) deacylase)